MTKIKCLAVFAMLVVMAVFSSCGAKAMSISEAVEAINKLKSGESITIVLNNDTAEITEELRRALADESYFDKSSDDFDDYDDWYEYLKQNSKKVSLDLSKTKITEIAEFAFMDCVSLASVTMPDSVTSIGDSAFDSCVSLTSVTIPNSVTTIGDRAFIFCTSLTSVNIPNSVTTIGDSAFDSCVSLTSVTIPNSVTEIRHGVFCGCESLTSVTIPDSVTSIGDSAFDSCVSLTSVTIPAGVTGIGNSFGGCDNLSISVANDNKYLSAKDGALYNKNGTLLIAWPAAKGDVIIPDSVTSIRHGAFEYCTSLTSVTIPNSVTTIGDRAFIFCTSLTSVNIPNSVTTIEGYAFDSCESLHVEIAPHPDGNLRVPENAFESGAKVSFRGTTGTWREIRAKYWR